MQLKQKITFAWIVARNGPLLRRVAVVNIETPFLTSRSLMLPVPSMSRRTNEVQIAPTSLANQCTPPTTLSNKCQYQRSLQTLTVFELQVEMCTKVLVA